MDRPRRILRREARTPKTGSMSVAQSYIALYDGEKAHGLGITPWPSESTLQTHGSTWPARKSESNKKWDKALADCNAALKVRQLRRNRSRASENIWRIVSTISHTDTAEPIGKRLRFL